jgi:hypothetical protein
LTIAAWAVVYDNGVTLLEPPPVMNWFAAAPMIASERSRPLFSGRTPPRLTRRVIADSSIRSAVPPSLDALIARGVLL